MKVNDKNAQPDPPIISKHSNLKKSLYRHSLSLGSKEDLHIKSILPRSLALFPSWLESHVSDPFRKDMVYLILSTTTWYLWIERNIPPSGWFKLNADGSLSYDRGGYGALLRNNNADFIAGLAGRLDLHSINLLELKAIERGIQLGLSNAVTNLWIESDSITAIAWVHGMGCIPWTALRSIRQIHQGLHLSKCWKVSHIHREGNSPANLLAAHRSSRREMLLRPQQLWMEIRTAIEEDKLL
ncbi:hypothetical protein QJS04_geneDACA014728 [Acorus gramineus]|uniref:RNase H type-1 domain-containing protein n=1 Tax=Acorus gramineus TaxID=55184 RepID=A0AAV9A087_ACOGR|nr:hypothetical protein QJS04_geneDACA014728 [Acorus gramineus]